jgi:hypothetical protein
MDIQELYNKLDAIFQKHTTRQWKGGWQPWNNLFLLLFDGREIELHGPNGFKVRVDNEFDSSTSIRIGIEAKQMSDLDIYYYVYNELDWQAHSLFIIDLCQKIYDANCQMKEIIDSIPSNIYGEDGPQFANKYRRDLLLDNLI